MHDSTGPFSPKLLSCPAFVRTDASHLAFELYKNKTNGNNFYVARYNGKPFKVRGCAIICPADEFERLLRNFTATSNEEWKEACKE